MLRPGQAIVLCVLALLTLGVVMVNSADMTLGTDRAVTLQSIVLSRSSAYMVLALIALLVCSLVRVGRFAGRFVGQPVTEPARGSLFGRLIGPIWMWVVVVVLLGVLATVYLPGVGREMNGSHRWLEVSLPG